MTRADRVKQVYALREAGLTFKEIGEALGIALSTAHDYHNDPDGSKARARKERNNGVCVDCGGATRNGGSVETPDRCSTCRHEFEKSDHDLRRRRSLRSLGRYRWSDAEILDAIRSCSTNGVVTVTDYETAYAENPTAMPSRPLITKRFDLWSNAVSAAGLECVRQGGAYSNRMPTEGLILAVQECAAVVGRAPTYSEYQTWARAVGAPSAQTVRNRLGSWIEALDAAELGLEVAA